VAMIRRRGLNGRPPWPVTAELPLMVQPVSVIVFMPVCWNNGLLARPPPLLAELLLTVQSVSVAKPPALKRPPPEPTVPLGLAAGLGSMAVLLAAAELFGVRFP